MLDKLRNSAKKIVGTKQVSKAIYRGEVEALYIAKDAEKKVVDQLINLAEEHSLEVYYVETMAELGRTCGIEVQTASAAVVRQ